MIVFKRFPDFLEIFPREGDGGARRTLIFRNLRLAGLRGVRLRGWGWERRLASLERDSERTNNLPPTAGNSDHDPCPGRALFVRSQPAFPGPHPSAEMSAAPAIGKDKWFGLVGVGDNTPPSESGSASEQTNSSPSGPTVIVKPDDAAGVRSLAAASVTGRFNP